MRLFVSSSFEPGFMETLADISSFARSGADQDAVKWVENHNFHLTYAFLGELPESAVGKVVESVDAAFEGRKAPHISLGDLGVFPSERDARVIWLGVGEGAQALRDMAAGLSRELAARGLAAYENSFEPHITLGRVKRALPGNFFRRVRAYLPGKSAVSELSGAQVMQSEICSQAPQYKALYSKSFL